jgi:hypothetical protein
MVVVSENVVLESTTRRQLAYMLTAKHHDGKDHNAARWLIELTTLEEFSVFELADFHEIADDDGNLYGVLRSPPKALDDVSLPKALRRIGTHGQQMAKFWAEAPEKSWHGFPLWALDEAAPPRLQKEEIPKAMINLLQEKQLIAKQHRRRLMRGDHA